MRTVLPWAWGALVLVGAWGGRPRRTRMAPSTAMDAEHPGPVSRLGRLLRRSARRPPDADADRWVGWAAVTAVVIVPVVPALAPVPFVVAAAAPRAIARRRERAETADVADALPEAVDLFSLAVGAGLTLPLALPIVAERTPPPLGADLETADRRRDLGEPLAEALEAALGDREAARPLVSVLVASLRDGAPLAEPLTRLADDLRQDRRRVAEARARRVPVQMLFPLVLCTLPAFVLVTIVPVLAGALRGLRA